MILKRYIFSQLALSTVLVTIILTGAIWLTQSLRFVDIVVTRGVSFWTFIYFIFFLLPDLITLALPIGLLISTLITYNKLISDHELVVMRTAGCSDLFLLSPMVKLSGILLVILYSLTLYILPLSFQKFREMEVHLRHHQSSSMIRTGEFNYLGNIMVYVQSRSSDGALKGLLIHDGRDPAHVATITAEKGLIIDEEKGVRFVLIKGNRQEFDLKNHRPSFLKFDQYTLQFHPEKTAGARSLKPYEMTFFELLKPGPHLTTLQKQKLRSEVHNRLLSPLYAFSFGLLAVLFLLRASGRRSGYPLRICSIILLCTFIQGGSLALLQYTTAYHFTIPCAYLLVLSPVLFLIFHLIQRSQR